MLKWTRSCTSRTERGFRPVALSSVVPRLFLAPPPSVTLRSCPLSCSASLAYTPRSLLLLQSSCLTPGSRSPPGFVLPCPANSTTAPSVSSILSRVLQFMLIILGILLRHSNTRMSSRMFVWPVLTFCSFSSCYGESSTQQEIFDRDVEPLIQLAFSGVVRDYTAIYQLRSHTPLQTVTVFAYGVTSSGKTHTMQGNPSQPGIIPRAVEVS